MGGDPVGVVGLGNMGGALAANLVRSGHGVVVHDALGPDRAPDGTTGSHPREGAPSVIGPVTTSLWERFAAADPGADFTRIFPFVADS